METNNKKLKFAMLFSGGKDSTIALGKIIRAGYMVLFFYSVFLVMLFDPIVILCCKALFEFICHAFSASSKRKD